MFRLLSLKTSVCFHRALRLQGTFYPIKWLFKKYIIVILYRSSNARSELQNCLKILSTFMLYANKFQTALLLEMVKPSFV